MSVSMASPEYRNVFAPPNEVIIIPSDVPTNFKTEFMISFGME